MSDVIEQARRYCNEMMRFAGLGRFVEISSAAMEAWTDSLSALLAHAEQLEKQRDDYRGRWEYEICECDADEETLDPARHRESCPYRRIEEE